MNRFRPTSQNVLGKGYTDELVRWGWRTFEAEKARIQDKVMADGAPPLNQRTSPKQQYDLLSKAAMERAPWFMSNPQAQEALRELERKGAGGDVSAV